MITGPIAVVIVSVLVLWVSEAPVSLIGILVFIAAALPTWLVLHLVQAPLLSALIRHRSPWMPPALGVTQSRAALDSDMRDPVYRFALLGLWAIKWALVVTAGFALAIGWTSGDDAIPEAAATEQVPLVSDSVLVGVRDVSAIDESVTETAEPASSVLAVEQTPGDSSSLQGVGFRSIADGVEMLDATFQAVEDSIRISAVRLDEASPGLFLATSGVPIGPGRTLRRFRELHDAMVVLSGGYVRSFDPPLPEGLVKSDGEVQNRATPDPILNGLLLFNNNGGVAIEMFRDDLTTDGEWPSILQTGPLLIYDGQSALPDITDPADSVRLRVIEQRYTRAFVCVDAEGRASFGITRNSTTLPNLVDLFLPSPSGENLGCSAAVALPRGGLIVAQPSDSLTAGDVATRLPNALFVPRQSGR